MVGIGLVLNMDDCPGNDDDEEHHRVFFSCFDAKNDGHAVFRQGVDPATGKRIFDPACMTIPQEPSANHHGPALIRVDGRSISR
jgi:hypothetical protein